MLLAVNLLEEGIFLGTIIFLSTALFVISGFIALKFEVEAGYYECKSCHHRFIPTFIQTLMAPHIHTIRYMRCPRCNEKSWTKKVMSQK